MTRSRRRLWGAVRLGRLGALGGALACALAACTCPAPTHLDQLFLLDARPGAPLVAFDAGARSIDPGSARDASLDGAGALSSDAGVASSNADGGSSDAGGASSDAGGFSDAATPEVAALDCTSAAAGCAPGGDCLPACNCVLARAGGLQGVAAIDGCQLVAGAAAPTVEVRYEVRVFCPGD
jgi:hypothetical protein